MMNQDNETKITNDTDGVKVHKFKYNDETFQLIQVDDRFDISQIMKICGMEWRNFTRDRMDLWTEISETIMNGESAIITYKCKIKKLSAKVLHCIPPQLLASALAYCNDDILSEKVINAVMAELGGPIPQFAELECKLATDQNTGLVWAISERNGDYCNISLVIEAARSNKDIDRNKYLYDKYMKKKGTIQTMETIMSMEYPDTDNTMMEQLCYKQYGVQWMHSKLAIKFAMDMSPSYEYAVLDLVDRISKGDCTVIGDVIQAIDQVNGTKTLAELYTFDKETLENDEDIRDIYERKLGEMEAIVERANNDRRVAEYRYQQIGDSIVKSDQIVANAQESLKLVRQGSELGPEVTNEMMKWVNRRKGRNLGDVFQSVGESHGYYRKHIQELEGELRLEKTRCNALMDKTKVYEEAHEWMESQVESFDEISAEQQRIVRDAKRYAGRVMEKAVKMGYPIKLTNTERELLDTDSVFRFESNAIVINKKTAAIIEEKERCTAENLQLERKQYEDSKSIKPANDFDFSPVYSLAGVIKDDREDMTMDAVYMYVKSHVSGTIYNDWVRYDFGEPFISNVGYSIMLCDAPFLEPAKSGLTFTASFHRSPVLSKEWVERSPTDEETNAAHRCIKTSTMQLLQTFAAQHATFNRAAGNGRIMICEARHPKHVERSLMSLMRPFLSHKVDYKDTVVHKWDNWVSDYVPLDPMY
jgi:hypothetical protein